MVSRLLVVAVCRPVPLIGDRTGVAILTPFLCWRSRPSAEHPDRAMPGSSRSGHG